MSPHLTIWSNKNHPRLSWRGDKFVKNDLWSISGDSSWGYDLFCDQRQGLSWGDKICEKGSVTHLW